MPRGVEYPYVTIPESLLLNAERHRLNGDRHLREGRPSFAAGSYRKAERNILRSRLFLPWVLR